MRQTERVKGDQLPYRANKPSGIVATEASAAQGLRHAFGHHALRTASQKISRSVRAPTRSAHGSELAAKRLHRRQPLSRWRKIERQPGIVFRLPMGALAFALSDQ